MPELRRYRNLLYDSARWWGFALRPGDIVVTTPPKCGTTWTQALCAYLVHDRTELDMPLSELSPWLDQQTADLGSVVAGLEAQQHRRVIKTHTPLDGLPYDERVTYLCVGRDPRDVAVSLAHHRRHIRMEAVMAAREAAVGLADLAELGEQGGARPDDPGARLRSWIEDPAPPPASTLANLLDQLSQAWARRHDPGVHLFHYGDLQADLRAEVARLADVLGVRLTEQRLGEIAAAAGFERMRARAGELAPNAAKGFWQDPADFFHRGTSGQWREVFTEEDVARYERRAAALAPPDLLAWAHGGWAALR